MSISWAPPLPVDGGPLFLAIADALATDLAAGRLTPGDRLPSQRDLADTLGVALGTVTRGYAEAERRGLVRGRGRRGTVVADGGRQRSRLSSLVDTGGLIDLSANHPTSSLDPNLAATLKTLAARSDTAAMLHYPPPDGLVRHREAAARWLETQGVTTAADTIVVTAGAQHGIEVTLAAVAAPGDSIACEPLTYPGVKAVAERLGMRLIPVPADDEGIDPDGLDHLCRAHAIRALYTIPTIQNPTGAMLPAARKRVIADVARRHDLLILEDEIHRPLTTRTTEPFVALASERSFLITSAAKALAGGLRVGFVVGPRAHRTALAESVMASVIGVSPLLAEVFTSWVDDGSAGRTVTARRKEARARQQEAQRMLGSVDGRLRAHPDSYYVWLELPDRWSESDFVREARGRGVAVASGNIFMVAADPTRAVRIALSAPPSRDHLRAGLQRLAELLADEPGSAMATL